MDNQASIIGENITIDKFKTKRTIALVFLISSFFVFGIVDLVFCYSQNWSSASWLIHSIIITIATYSWCAYDANIRKILIPGWLKFLILMVTILAVICYLVRSRGWKGAAKIGFGIPVFLLCLLLYCVSEALAELIIQPIGY